MRNATGNKGHTTQRDDNTFMNLCTHFNEKQHTTLSRLKRDTSKKKKRTKKKKEKESAHQPASQNQHYA
jgi:hypothetical protein